MSTPSLRTSILSLIVFAGSNPTLAQDAAQPTTYVQVDCMKSTSPDYQAVETEIWQPMHQEMVRLGRKSAWSLYWVQYGDRSECDYYTVNTYLGNDQLNDETSFASVFEAVHPGKSWEDASARTGASRQMVRSELWVWVDGVQPESHQLAAVNYMSASDGAAYVDMEREIYKPIHEALVDAGHRAGWGVYQLAWPQGTALSYNYGTVNFMHELGSVPWMQTMEEVHGSGRGEAIGQRTEEIREMVRTEVWRLMATTTP